MAVPEVFLSGIRDIVVLGDPGCTFFSPESRKVLERILFQKADLFFILGDLAFLDTEEEFQEIVDFCNARAQAPVFALRGNHDLNQYDRFLGKETYAIVLDRFVCFFLCNAAGRFERSALELLAKTLIAHPGKDFLIFMHIPPAAPLACWSLSREEWHQLKEVLDPHKERVRKIFCGHIHGFYEYEVDGYPVTITAGGGAAMIHATQGAGQKIHHSIKLELRPDGSIRQTLVPVEETSPGPGSPMPARG